MRKIFSAIKDWIQVGLFIEKRRKAPGFSHGDG